MHRMPRIQPMTCFYVAKTYSLVETEVTLNIYLFLHPFCGTIFTNPTSVLPQTHGNFSFPCFHDLLQSVLHFHIATAFNSSKSKQLIFSSELVNSVAHRNGRGWKL